MKNSIKMKNLKLMALVFSMVLFSQACSNDDDAVVEEEVITTVIVTLTSGGQTTTLTSRDLDGDGPNAPLVVVSGSLLKNTTYTGSIQFLNELESPAENITAEIAENDKEHQVFYRLSNGLGSFTYADFDSNGKPLGLQFSLTTANSSGNGNLTVILKHLLNKNAPGVASGDVTNAGGSTDVEVVFPVVVN